MGLEKLLTSEYRVKNLELKTNKCGSASMSIGLCPYMVNWHLDSKIPSTNKRGQIYGFELRLSSTPLK